MKGTDKNCTPIVDPYSSEIVRRIFEMRAAGYNVKRIVDVLNREHASCVVAPMCIGFAGARKKKDALAIRITLLKIN